MIVNLILAPPFELEGTTDVQNWVSVAEDMLKNWGDAKSSTVHFLNITSALFLYYAFRGTEEASYQRQQFLTGLQKNNSRLKSPLGYLITLYILAFLLAEHQMFMSYSEGQSPARWSPDEGVKALEVIKRVLKVLARWWPYAHPLYSLAEGMGYLFKGQASRAVSVWKKGIKAVSEVSEHLKFLKAIFQVRIVRNSKGNDAMELEVADFLQRIGARTELALLAGEAFSPLSDEVEFAELEGNS